MDQRSRAVVASVGIVFIFLAVQFGALALVEPFKDAGYQPVEDPDDPTNSLVYVGAVLVITAMLLAAVKLDFDRVLRGFIVFAGAYISLYVFQIGLPAVEALPTVAGFHLLAWLAAALLGLAVWFYPEWYVIDGAGMIMGIGAAGLFGITFGIFPAILLLVVLAVYDAISVYGTEHMLALASGVMDMRVPIVLVVPLSLTYSFLDSDLPDPVAENEASDPDTDGDGSEAATEEEPVDDGDSDSPLDREALFIGLGDAIIPAVLVASAGFFLQDVPTVALLGLEPTLPALTAMGGTLLGLGILLRMVLAGRAHAGLPLLNGGAILGYLAGALASGLTLTQALGVAALL